MQKISVTSFQVKPRPKKHFSCQKVGGLSKISSPFSSSSSFISVTENNVDPSFIPGLYRSVSINSLYEHDKDLGFIPLRPGSINEKQLFEFDEHHQKFNLFLHPLKAFQEVKTQTSNDEINEQEDFQDYLQQQPAPIIAQVETPLFGSISVIKNPFAENHCNFCGKALSARAPGTKGRPQVSHPECGQLSRSLDYFANSLEKIPLTPAAIRRLRSRLFQISNGLQMPRDFNGRFTRFFGGV